MFNITPSLSVLYARLFQKHRHFFLLYTILCFSWQQSYDSSFRDVRHGCFANNSLVTANNALPWSTFFKIFSSSTELAYIWIHWRTWGHGEENIEQWRSQVHIHECAMRSKYFVELVWGTVPIDIH